MEATSFRAGQPYDDKTDAWSLGVLLFELCALRLPFEANVMPALVLKICRDEAPPLPSTYSDVTGRELSNQRRPGQSYAPAAVACAWRRLQVGRT